MMRRVAVAGVAAGALAAAIGGLATATGGALPSSRDGIGPSLEEKPPADCVAASGEVHVMGLAVRADGLGSYAGTFDQGSKGVEATHLPNNPMRITVSSVALDGDRATFAWSANMPVDQVVVRSGGRATVYDYAGYGWGGHPALGPWGDVGLVAPDGAIDEILFCTLKKLRVEKTAVATAEEDVTWTVDKQVKAAGGTYGDNATIALVDGGAGSATWRIAVTRTATATDPTVHGEIAVLNSSPFTAEVELTESLANAALAKGCDAFELAGGASVTCAYSASLPEAVDGVNRVDATVTSPDWMPGGSATAPYSFGKGGKDGAVSWTDSNGRSKEGITGSDVVEYDQPVDCGKGDRQHVVNEVTLRGSDGETIDTDTATLDVVCSTPSRSLLVSKTADLHWKRITTWDVAKRVGPSSLALADGNKGTVSWTIDVTRTGSESTYRVVGSITVTNPNGFDVPGVAVAESMAGARVSCGLGDAVKAPAAPVTIPAGATLNCVYTAGIGDNVGGTNRVTVTSALEGVGGSAEDTWQALSAPDDGDLNASVSVVDQRLSAAWRATGSDDDRTITEELPCANATAVNTVELRGDDTSTGGTIETDHLLDSASAQVTTTCTTTPPPSTPPPTTVTVPPVPKTPVAKPPVTKQPKPKKPTVKKPEKPTVKKPKPKPACIKVGVSARTVQVGDRTIVTFVTTRRGETVGGIRLELAGPGIDKHVHTGPAGRVATVLAPTETGIVEVTLPEDACARTRIGVVAPAEPPVTG